VAGGACGKAQRYLDFASAVLPRVNSMTGDNLLSGYGRMSGVFIDGERINLEPTTSKSAARFWKTSNFLIPISKSLMRHSSIVCQAAKGEKGNTYPRHIIDMCIKMLNRCGRLCD